MAVADDGPGIAAEDLELAARRFWRAPAHRNVQGFGLGLSIAQSLLESVGGRLEFAAEHPSDLRVRLWLPRARVDGAARGEGPRGADTRSSSIDGAQGFTAR